MNKNRKIVAVISALAMIFSMFTSLTVVNAAETGITLTVSNAKATSATVAAEYVGFDNGISFAKVAFTVPSGTKVVSSTPGINGTTIQANDTVDGKVTASVTGFSDNTKAADGKTIATFDIEWTDALEEDFTIELLDTSYLQDLDADFESTTYTIANGGLNASTAVLPADPNATPKPTPIATRAPKPTPGTAEPTKAPVTVTKGIKLEASDLTDESVTITAKYVGFDNGISFAKVAFTVPSGATVASSTPGISGTTIQANDTVDGKVTASVTGFSDNTKAADGETIATFVIKLAQPLTENFDVELLDTSYLQDLDADFESTTYTIENGGLAAAWTTIKVSGGGDDTNPTPTPKAVGKVTLPDVDITEGDLPADADTSGNLYIALKVTDKDGNEAKYGTDYVASLKLPDGTTKTLTEEELGYILNGYFDLVEGAETMTWADVIDGLTLHALASGVTFEAQLIDDSTDKVIAGGIKTVTGSTTTPKPSAAPSITVSYLASGKKTLTVVIDKTIQLTATVANVPEGVEGVWSYEISETDASKYLEPMNEPAKDSEEYKVRFLGLAAKTAVPVTFYYKDAATGENIAEPKKVNVKVTKEDSSSSGGGGSDTSGAGGSIARGGSVVTTGQIAFTDIDTVPWAEDAILALVDMGVINGRSNTIFDPNGTVTRAEFAKMVVLGFGLSGAADGNFSDVVATEWYAPYVQIGYANGVISGYDDGTFRPNGLISRQEMAAMIARAISAANKTLPETVAAAEFEDAWQIGDWAKPSVEMLQKGGVINGMTETTYEPLSNATRAQSAVIIYRAITNAK